MPEIPRIPRGRLWACLLGPLGAVIVWVLLIVLLSNSGSRFGPEATRAINGGLGFLVSAVSLASLIGFILLLSKRYTTRNVVLMTFGYLIGYLVVVPGLAVGACFLIAAA